MSYQCDFLHDLDLFGKSPEFYYKKRSKKTTLIGRIFTILYFAAYVAFFIYKLVKMIQRVDVTFYDTFAFTGEIPSIQLTKDNFYGGFGILGPNGEPFVDETIYYATTIFWSGKKTDGVWDWQYKMIPLERCQLEKFGSKFQHMFKDKDLNNMYCLGDIDVVLEGYATSESYSYFEVNLYPCMGTTSDGTPCMPEPVLQAYLTKNNFMFKMQDIELTPQDYKSPVQEREKDISGPVYSDLKQQIYAYLQVTNIETDEDIIGFGLSNIKKEKFLKYDESWIISAPMTSNIFTSGEPFSVITVQLSEKALTQKRTYTTLIEVLGDVGGLMEVLMTVVNLLLSFIVDSLYEKSLINNLFEFDLDKKVIIIKEKQKEDNFLPKDGTPQIFSPLKQISSARQTSLFMNEDNNNNTIQTKNKLNEEPLSKNKLEGEISPLSPRKAVKKKKKKKKVNKMYMTSMGKDEDEIKENLYGNIIKKDEANNNNIYNQKNEKEFVINNEVPNEIKEMGIETERGNQNRRIVKKIKLNKFCTYCGFFCSRKRKTLENTLLDEGMNIIIDQLDIINVFRKMYKDEKLQEQMKEMPVEMSDECKVKMNELINQLYESWHK